MLHSCDESVIVALGGIAQRPTAAGTPFKVVMAACMRKLLTILNTMARNNEPWRIS